MAILKVARLGHPILRQVARPIHKARVGSDEVQRLVDDMIETMREYDGIGLAAPQVHASVQLVVYEARPGSRRPQTPKQPPVVLINPVLTPLGERVEEDWEGCLSLPDLRGRVPRHVKVQVAALNREGKPRDFVAKDFHARVVQHECDHLAGRVFLDRMADLSSLALLPEFLRFAGVDGDVE